MTVIFKRAEDGIMSGHHGNLSDSERTVSALIGLGLTAVACARGPATLRAISGFLAAGLFARAAAGHCAVKSALSGRTSLQGGIQDQWESLRGRAQGLGGLPGSPRHQHQSRAVDQAAEDSFPASDPPASRLPDEPPSNAEAKWAAARAAGKVE
jgi:hypothetical protein